MTQQGSRLILPTGRTFARLELLLKYSQVLFFESSLESFQVESEVYKNAARVRLGSEILTRVPISDAWCAAVTVKMAFHLHTACACMKHPWIMCKACTCCCCSLMSATSLWSSEWSLLSSSQLCFRWLCSRTSLAFSRFKTSISSLNWDCSLRRRLCCMLKYKQNKQTSYFYYNSVTSHENLHHLTCAV